MSIVEYVNPVSDTLIQSAASADKHKLFNTITIYGRDNSFDISAYHLVIVGLPASNDASAEANGIIRKELYDLFKPDKDIKVLDLGDIKHGATPKDTQFGIRTVFEELLEKNVIPIVIGESSDAVYPLYLAYEKLEKPVNIVSVNSRPEIGIIDESYAEQPFLSQLVINKSKFLFNYTNLCYQSYLVSPNDTALLNKMLFDRYRLGVIRSDFHEVEAVMRDADLVSFNLSAIKQSDAPGVSDPCPNGLYSEEACQVSRYAGISDKVSLFGLFGYNPILDRDFQTARLAAHTIWYFIDGVYDRKKDYPIAKIADYKKFVVFLSKHETELVFYKSDRSSRWWMQVSVNKSEKKRNIIVACTYQDYQKACNQEVPDRWWKTFQKIS